MLFHSVFVLDGVFRLYVNRADVFICVQFYVLF